MNQNETNWIFNWQVDNSCTQAQPDSWDPAAPTLMCATDNHYVQPLAAALASAAANYSGESSAPLQLILLDGGIEEQQWNKFQQLVLDKKIRTIRLQANHDSVAQLSISHHISHTAYFRLLSSQWLPEWVGKVIYLDCDTIVLDDLAKLWQFTSANDHEVWAVPDIACPFIDAKSTCDDYQQFGPYLAAVNPVANFRALGIAPENLYFNSGVMVLDLQKWRSNDRSRQLLDCLQSNQKYVWCWDQYALNVVFANDWGQLPLRWNFGSHVYDYPLSEEGFHLGPIFPQQVKEMQQNPAVVHFTTEIKPWHYYCFHPLKDLYFQYLDQTPWANQRPSRPGFSTWWHVQTFKFQKQLLAAGRRFGF